MLPSSSLPEVTQRDTVVAMVSVERAADAKGANSAGDDPRESSWAASELGFAWFEPVSGTSPNLSHFRSFCIKLESFPHTWGRSDLCFCGFTLESKDFFLVE